MKHTFNIKDKSAKRTSIRLIVSHQGKVFRRYTGLIIDRALWDEKRKTLRAICKDDNVWERLKPINARLEQWEESAKTEDDVLAVMEYAIAGKGESPNFGGFRQMRTRPSFWEYFREWGERPSPVQRQRRLYPNIVSKLMGEREDWEDIDSAYYYRLCKRMDEYGCSLNYKGSIISKLKVVMNEGLRQKFHTNTDFREFRRMAEVPETISLTKDELDAIWNYETKSSMEAKARDLFIIGTYSASRWEDCSQFTLDNITGDGMLNYTQKKTGHAVIIPASPRLVACLERNGGRSPQFSQQKYNDAIKEVCRKIGMTGKVHYSRSVGAARKQEVSERWQMVSSHTARRTGATMLYMSGVPIKQCMLITGHTTESNFLRYVRITKEENAAKLKDNPFFK